MIIAQSRASEIRFEGLAETEVGQALCIWVFIFFPGRYAALLLGEKRLGPVSLSPIDLDIGSILFGARTGRGPAMGTTIVKKVAIGKDKEQVFPRGGCLAAFGTIKRRGL